VGNLDFCECLQESFGFLKEAKVCLASSDSLNSAARFYLTGALVLKTAVVGYLYCSFAAGSVAALGFVHEGRLLLTVTFL
jgi:hypothetical protein